MITVPIEIALSDKSRRLLDFLKTLDQPATTISADTKANTAKPPSHGEYWPGQGGHYICTLPALLGMPARHLIAGAKHHEGLTFGPRDDVLGATSMIDGAANTAALMAHSSKHPAAKWARDYTADGHSDFFLPAKLDLVMAHICAKQLFHKSGWYWTSTQISSNVAFAQVFENGDSYWSTKDDEFRVCPVRVIPL